MRCPHQCSFPAIISCILLTACLLRVHPWPALRLGSKMPCDQYVPSKYWHTDDMSPRRSTGCGHLCLLRHWGWCRDGAGWRIPPGTASRCVSSICCMQQHILLVNKNKTLNPQGFIFVCFFFFAVYRDIIRV